MGIVVLIRPFNRPQQTQAEIDEYESANHFLKKGHILVCGSIVSPPVVSSRKDSVCRISRILAAKGSQVQRL